MRVREIGRNMRDMRRIVIIGAGIVGTAIANQLSAINGIAVTVIERGTADQLPGSTGHAPGYVGLLGESPVLTDLARSSAATYDTLGLNGVDGFARVGAIEIAITERGERILERRAEMAIAAGLPAHLIDPGATIALAPELIEPGSVRRGLHFPDDGTARASIITANLRARSETSGARYVNSNQIVGIDSSGNQTKTVHTATATFEADDVVIAAGIWSPLIARMIGFDLPLTPVEHPYVYGPPRSRALPPLAPMPFVRWPEDHVYARHHGARFGFGTYDHEPRPVAPERLAEGAERPWPASIFDDAIAQGMTLLPGSNRFLPALRLNGLFAMTPDNLPFLGAVPGHDGVWVAAAIWITHAAGSAEVLVDLMMDRPARISDCAALRPGRFAATDAAELERRTLKRYRDIYSFT